MPLNQPPSFKQKKLRKLIEHVQSLLVVFLMIAATAVMWSGKFLGHEIGTPRNSSAQATSKVAQPTKEQLQKLNIAANATLVVRDSASWTITAANGNAQGVVISTALYAKDVKGFAGPTPLYIYVDTQGVVKNIIAADNAETASFFDRAFSQLIPQWTGKRTSEASTLQVDAVTGATFSSKALIANVQQTLAAQNAAAQEATISQKTTIGWGRTIAVFFVLLTGALISIMFRGHKILRMAQLVLNVVVLGFWCGQFLSLSLLRGWVANGLDPIVYLPTLLMLATAVIMPFFRRKHHYCSWICPLGSLQELASHLPFPKVHCSPKVYKAMSRIRLVCFALLMFVLWTALGGAEILDYEPFTAFFITTATPAVMGLCAAIVVASCFVPNVWCKCLCPMGQTLELAEKNN